MTFAWPIALVALVLVPLFVFAYVMLLRRRAKRADELAAQGFRAAPSTAKRRRYRHIPYVFFLLGLSTLVFGLARPQASVTVPRREATVVLAFDVSNSMLAKDLEPTRIDAAKKAAKGFVAKQPLGYKIGIVAFSDSGVVTQRPTDDRALVNAAIDRLRPQGGTSIGQAIFTSLGAIAGAPIKVTPEQVDDKVEELDIGYFSSATIVMLSDGEDTSDLEPEAFAKLASVAGVRVHTIGIGKPEGTEVEIKGFKIATALDEELLKEIAKVSGGNYYQAADEAELAKVYKSIDLKWVRQKENTELTGIMSAAGIGLFSIGALLSLAWFGRLV